MPKNVCSVLASISMLYGLVKFFWFRYLRLLLQKLSEERMHHPRWVNWGWLRCHKHLIFQMCAMSRFVVIHVCYLFLLHTDIMTFLPWAWVFISSCISKFSHCLFLIPPLPFLFLAPFDLLVNFVIELEKNSQLLEN